MRRFILTSLVLIFTLLSGCSRAANMPAFYGEFCDAGRTSYKDIAGLKETPGKVTWKHNLSYACESLLLTTNAPTIEGNRA